MLLPSSEGIAQYLEAQESFVKVLRSINNVAAAASDDTPWASFVVFVDFMFKTNASIHSDNSFSWTTSFVFEMKKHSTFQNKQRDLGRDLIIFHQFTEGNSAQFRKPLGYNGRKKNKSLILQHGANYSKIRKSCFFGKKALSKPLKRSIFKEQKRFKSQSSIQCIWGTFWVSTY